MTIDIRNFGSLNYGAVVMAVTSDMILINRPLANDAIDIASYCITQQCKKYLVWRSIAAPLIYSVNDLTGVSLAKPYNKGHLPWYIRPGALMFAVIGKVEDKIIQQYIRGRYNTEFMEMFERYHIADYELP